MKNLILSSVLVLIASSAAQAQQAVQWRVEDGGNGHWYGMRPIDYSRSWSDFIDTCAQIGATPAVLTSSSDADWISSHVVTNPPGDGALLGAELIPTSGGVLEWRWIDGRSFSSSVPWCGGAPTGPTELEHWIYMNDQAHAHPTAPAGCLDDCPWGGWSSINVPWAVIEWSADCNGDGIVDYGQILDDYLSDLDGDNIPDCCEQGVSCGQFGSGMEAYFGFDGDCLDASGNGRHGLSTGLGYTRGPAALPGTAAAFDGLSSDVRIEGVPIPTNNAFSWALWLRADAVAESVEGAAIVERIESIGNNLLSPSLFLRPDGALGFGSYSYSSGGTSVETAPNTVTAGSWFHVACTSAQSGLRRVYVNGMLVGENLSVDYGHPLPMILIGRDRLDCCSRFRGAIDDLRFYSRPLTSAEVDALYRAASICPGDITNGGTVDATDLSIVLAAWGTNGQGEFQADIDGSGLVDGGDLALVLSGWGPCPQ
jgi:hypothetical protein